MRVVAAPFDADVVTPEPRSGVVAPGLHRAIYPAAGLEGPRARLSEPDVLVVTTGQQPGLFTGPLYTVYKALSAAALARQLEHRWGRPVVPVFWVAADDHDFAEASRASWLGGDGEIVTAGLAERPADAPLTPMSKEALKDEVLKTLEALASTFPASEHGDAARRWLAAHYTPGATVAAAFGGALAELLAPYGVLCLDAAHEAVKAASAPILLAALTDAKGLDADLASLRDRRAAEGRDVTVPLGDGATLVFLEDRLGRDRLMLADQGFVTRRAGDAFDLDALRRVATSEPRRLSPNVLLRPVVESALLPTVAYMAGPGEMAYLPLAEPVYRRLGVPRQTPVPRWSGVLVEPRVDRILEKFSASLDEVLMPAPELEARIARDQLPEEVVGAFTALREEIARHYAVIQQGALSVDPTLEKPVASAWNHAVSGTRDVEKKILQHLKRRSAVELGQVARVRAAVLPVGKPQERVFTVAPYLARYGRELLARLAAEIEAWYASALDRV